MRILNKILCVFSILLLSMLVNMSPLITKTFADVTSVPVNLATNKSVQISVPDAQYDQLQGIGNAGSPLNQAFMLTDGVYGDVSNWQSPTWFKFYRNMKREVTVDLGDVDTINSLSIGFAQRNDVGIVPPLYVKYYVSNDNQNFTFLGKATPDVPLYTQNVSSINDVQRKIYTLCTVADGTPMNVQARYVKLVFINDTWGFADEIQVMGEPGIVNGAQVPPAQSDPTDTEVNQFPAKGSESAAKLSDQFLFYTGKYSKPEITDWTKDRVMPLVGYQDIYGNTKDWMFSNMLVLPVGNIITPSGGGKFVTKDDLESFVNFIMQPDTQLGAINKAAGEVNTKLGTDKKVGIEIAIPWIETSSNFGDIKGDGSTLSLNANDFASQVSDPNSTDGKLQMAQMALTNREAAIQWYINEVEKQFKDAGYENLQLTGYYWYNEKIDPSQGEDTVIQATSNYLKQIERYFSWIPYMGRFSPYVWKDLGFSTMSLQHNYAFGHSQKALIPAATDLAKRVGASLEIEYNDFQTLSKYLNCGYVTGSMTDTYHTYYLASTAIVESATAYNPTYSWQKVDENSAVKRSVYDRIYEFIKGTYTPRYAMTLSTDMSNTSAPTVSIKLPLADSIVQGNFSVHYDESKVSYSSFDFGSQFTKNGSPIGNMDVDANTPGVLHIHFIITDPSNAIAAELIKNQLPNYGAPELMKLHFVAKPGINSSDMSARMFMLNKDGNMIGSDGKTYVNWSESDILPGSPEDQIAKALDAVKKAEGSVAVTDVNTAKTLIKVLPDSPVKSSFQIRIINVEKQLDHTPPVTTETMYPSQPDGQNRWYVHPVTVTLTASDDLSDVTKIEYSLDDRNTWEIYSNPINFGQSGQYTIYYRSTDYAGNVETPQSVSFNIDNNKPTIDIQTPNSSSYSDTEELQPQFNINDDLSGVDNTKTVSTLDGTVLLQGTSTPLFAIDLGTHVYTVTAYDKAGNSSTETVQFQTTTSFDALKTLVVRFSNMGWIDNDGIENSLLKKLDEDSLNSFIQEVTVQTDKHISKEASKYLLRDAESLSTKK